MASFRLARQLSASHENIPPRLRLLARTRSLRLLPLVRTTSFRLRLGPHTEVGARDQGAHTNVAPPWRSNSPTATRKAPVLHAMQTPQLAGRVAACSDRSRNATLYACAASNTPSRPTSAARHLVRTGTQWPSTGGAYLHLGRNVAVIIHTQGSWVIHKRARRGRQVLRNHCVGTHTRRSPTSLWLSALCSALRCHLTDIDMGKKTSQHHSIVAHICIPFCPSPLRL
jgi:hypothetical protein